MTSDLARRMIEMLGAVAMLLRSVGNPALPTPHTGALTYSEDAPKTPPAALALEDADRLQRMQASHFTRNVL